MSRVEVRQLEPDEARARTGELAALLREAVDAGMALGQLAPVDTEQAFAEMIGALEPGERLLFGAFIGDELVGTAQLERAAPANSRPGRRSSGSSSAAMRSGREWGGS